MIYVTVPLNPNTETAEELESVTRSLQHCSGITSSWCTVKSKRQLQM